MNFDGIEVTKDELDGILPNVRIDISENNTWSRTMEQQEISNLFNNGKITLEEYAKMSPDHSNVPKDKLLQVVAERNQQMRQQPTGNPMENPQMMDDQYVQQTDQIPDQNVGEGLPYQALQQMMAQRQ